MQPTHRLPFAFARVTPLLVAGGLFGLALEAHTTATFPMQEDAPRDPAVVLAELAELGSDERLSELDLLRRTEGPAVVLAQLAKDKEALQRAWQVAKAEAEGDPANKDAQAACRMLDMTLAKLETFELVITARVDASGPATGQASQTAASDRTEVRRIVEEALARGNQGTLLQLGGAIEDVLTEVALEATHPVTLVHRPVDLLGALTSISAERGLAVALELASRPGRGWAAAVCTSLGVPWQRIESYGALRLDDGSPAPVPFALGLRLLGSDEVSADVRAAIAAPFLAAGIDDSRLFEAAERVLAEVKDLTRTKFYSRPLEAWHTRLLASGSVVERSAGARGRLAYADVDDLGLLERLLQDPSAEVRMVAAEHLPKVYPEQVAANAEYTALWARALGDPSAEVRRAAYTALHARACSATHPLSAPATAALIFALESPSEAAPAAALVGDLSSLIRVLPPVARSNEELGKVYATLLESKFVDVPGRVIDALSTGPHEVATATLENVGAPSAEVAQRLTNSLSSYQKLREAPAEACLRAFAHLVQLTPRPTPLDQTVREALEKKSRQHSLDSLSAEDAAEVLLRSADAAPGLVGGFLLRSNWERSEEVLALSSADPDRPPQEHALALLALERARPSTPASIAALVEPIAACFKDEREQDEVGEIVMWAAASFDDEPSALSALLIALLERPEIPTAAFAYVGWSAHHAEALSGEELGTLFDALERRAAASSSGPAPFSRFAAEALEAMQREPSLVRRALVLAWSEGFIASATTVGLRSSDRDLHVALRERILSQLENAVGPDQETALIAALIHLEGPSSAADDVANLAATVGKPELVRFATQLLESSAKLREVGARLASSSSGASRDAAVNEVVTLLDAPDEAVRIEAIRGLATLGAVEHLPRLIRIVGKGSPAERAAARAALDSLHQRAAKEAQQAAPIQAPPVQARDGEAPR